MPHFGLKSLAIDEVWRAHLPILLPRSDLGHSVVAGDILSPAVSICLGTCPWTRKIMCGETTLCGKPPIWRAGRRAGGGFRGGCGVSEIPLIPQSPTR